jgi:hypothetical protein
LRVFEGGCALGEGSLGVEAWPAPVVFSVASAIGRAAWGWVPAMQVYGEFGSNATEVQNVESIIGLSRGLQQAADVC